jgi:hypothetical protein
VLGYIESTSSVEFFLIFIVYHVGFFDLYLDSISNKLDHRPVLRTGPTSLHMRV